MASAMTFTERAIGMISGGSESVGGWKTNGKSKVACRIEVKPAVQSVVAAAQW